MKIDDYIVFEKIRTEYGGGGLLTAIKKSMKPVSIHDDIEEEILVGQSKVNNKSIRFVNAYGPQEGDDKEKRESFFNALDEVVKSAKIEGSMLCIEMDANSKLGSPILPGDPHPQSSNGKYLQNLVKLFLFLLN